MFRGRLIAWLLGPALLLGCGGAPKGEDGKAFSQNSSKPDRRSTKKEDATRRAADSAYRMTPDFGPSRGRKFEDVIPVGARITAVNVAVDDGVQAIWFRYELGGVESNTPRRGGAGGKTHVFKLKDNEKIVGIDAAGLDGIDQLTIATNRGVKTFGGDGTSAEPESWVTKKQARQYVGIGVTGRADDKVRQLSLRFEVRE